MHDADKAADTADKPQSPPTAPSEPRRRRRWPGLLALLLTLIAIAGGLLLSDRLDRWLPVSLHSTTVKIPTQQHVSTTPKPVVRHTHVTEQPVRTAPAQPPASRPTPPVHPAISSAEASALMQSIDQLNDSIRALREQQRSLQQALDKQQRMHLTIRLRWISAGGSKLPQIAMAWEEIYLLPGLSDEQRRQAEQMQQLANNDLVQIKRWQNTIEHWASHLAAPRQRDIIPQPEHPWLAWIASQFHLRKAPAAHAAELDELSHELFAVAQALGMEQWPDEQRWKQLRARLVLLAEAQHLPVDLPESFGKIAMDKARLQATARAWLKGDR